MSGYFVVYAILAIWVFFDARKRKNNVIGWPGATVFAGPLVLPVYLAKRHLKEGEVREGGTGWNVLKNFALFWTLTIVFFGIMIVVAASSQADGASAALGATLGIGMLGFVWFSVLVAALVLGLFLKKASVVEKGPTGPLAANQGGTVMQGVLLLCLLWSYPALAAAAPAASMDEVRQSIIQRCRNQMSDYGGIVKLWNTRVRLSHLMPDSWRVRGFTAAVPPTSDRNKACEGDPPPPSSGTLSTPCDNLRGPLGHQRRGEPRGSSPALRYLSAPVFRYEDRLERLYKTHMILHRQRRRFFCRV